MTAPNALAVTLDLLAEEVERGRAAKANTAPRRLAGRIMRRLNADAPKAAKAVEKRVAGLAEKREREQQARDEILIAGLSGIRTPWAETHWKIEVEYGPVGYLEAGKIYPLAGDLYLGVGNVRTIEEISLAATIEDLARDALAQHHEQETPE